MQRHSPELSIALGGLAPSHHAVTLLCIRENPISYGDISKQVLELYKGTRVENQTRTAPHSLVNGSFIPRGLVRRNSEKAEVELTDFGRVYGQITAAEVLTFESVNGISLLNLLGEGDETNENLSSPYVGLAILSELSNAPFTLQELSHRSGFQPATISRFLHRFNLKQVLSYNPNFDGIRHPNTKVELLPIGENLAVFFCNLLQYFSQPELRRDLVEDVLKNLKNYAKATGKLIESEVKSSTLVDREKIQNQILSELCDSNEKTLKELAQKLHRTEDSIMWHLKNLMQPDQQRVVRIFKAKRWHYKLAN